MSPLAPAKTSCLILALVACLSAGCPSAAPEGESARVRTGQRWRFVLSGVPETEQVYEVLAVDRAGVRYAVQSQLEGEPVGPPVELSFSAAPPPVWGDDPGEAVELTVSGVTLPCRRREQDERVTWTAGGEHPEFPGPLKISQDGAVILELVAIEQPD